MLNRPLLLLCGGLGAVLAGVLIVVMSDNGGEADDSNNSKERNNLSGLSPKTKKEPPEPAEPSPERVVIEPVAVNLRTLITGQSALIVSPEEVEATLDASGREPEDLIAAQAVLGDFAYLREAVEQEPENSEVLFWVLANDVYPQEREAWIEKYKAADPDNALGNYLAAQEAFRAQDTEKGMEQLRIAAGKAYTDPSVELRGQVETFYQKTGQFDRETAMHGATHVNAAPHVSQIQALSAQLLSQHRTLVESEDAAGAAEVMRLATEMLETVESQSTDRSANAKTMMLFMQEQILEASGDPDGTLEGLRSERVRIGGLGVQLQQIFAREDVATDEQLDRYAKAVSEMGEVAAMTWFIDEIGELPPLEEE